MKNPPSTQPSDDLSALAWVHDELRRSLETAHKALRRFVKESEASAGSDIDAVDPTVLRIARAQIHQGVGALEMVGLPAAATVLRASETLLLRVAAKPHLLTATLIADIEHASFALLDYLGRLLAGKPVSALAMFAQYRAVQEAAGAERVHPADLWVIDWQWRDLPADDGATSRQPDAATRALLEGQLLVLMKAPNAAVAAITAARMGDICAGLGVGATQPHIATFWKLASAVFEAQAHSLLGFDVFSKRVASRLLAQFRALERGGANVSERLAQDLLFFCAQAVPAGEGGDPLKTPRLTAVRRTYGLNDHVAIDYSISPLGRADPAVISQARKRVAAAKEAWSTVAGGEMHRISTLSEPFALVGESLKRLFPLGEIFAVQLQQAAAETQHAGAAPPPAVAMEVATSLLYIEAALEDADFDHPEQADRVQRLAERLNAVRQGHTPDALEKWMEELYRRVSDRQTMGSVVQELRASLSEAENLIDQFFRNPTDSAVLIPVPNHLSAMRGVLSVLGMDHAAAALLRIRDDINGLITTEVDPQRITQSGVFDRLAGNLGALGFLIDMLSVQPQMAKSLFSYDADTGMLSPVMGRGEVPPAADGAPADHRLIEQAQSLAFNSARQDVPTEDVVRDLARLTHEAHRADQPLLVSAVRAASEAFAHAADPADVFTARGDLSEALIDFVATATGPVGLSVLPVAQPPMRTGELMFTLNFDLPGQAAASEKPANVEPSSGTLAAHELAQDVEMREVFIAEAREVLSHAASARVDLDVTPENTALLTTLRRAFHTLKGSSRMVGLSEFGEAASIGEQLYITQLAQHRPTAAPLLEFTEWCLEYLAAWVEAVATHESGVHNADTVKAAAELVALGAAPVAGAEFAAVPVAAFTSASTSAFAAAPSDMAQDLSVDFDLDLSGTTQFPLTEPAPAQASETLNLSFDFELTGLDAQLDARIDARADSASAPSGVPIPVDTSPDALFELFELNTVESLPVPDVVEETELDPLPDFIDLGTGFEALPDRGFDSEADEIPAVDVDAGIGAGIAAGIAAGIDFDFDLDVDGNLAERLARSDAIVDEQVRHVGPLRISIPLFNIYLNEADELSRRLSTELAEWAMELHRPIGDAPVALAHSLAGSSATVGFADLSQLARSLEHAQARSLAIGHGTVDEARLFVDAAEEIRRLLHQFAAGFLKVPTPELLARLADHERSSALRLQAAASAAELPQVSQPAPLVPASPDTAELEFLSVAELVMDTVQSDLPVAQPAVVKSDFNSAPARFELPPLTELKPLGILPAEPERTTRATHELVDADDGIDAVDAIDAELFPIFVEEAEELLPLLASKLRDWVGRPTDAAPPEACMRTLHTFKGGARLAGAMRLGEMAHQLESRIEALLARGAAQVADVEVLESNGDALAHAFEALRGADLQAQSDAEQAFTRTASPVRPGGAFYVQGQPLQAVPAVIAEARAVPIDPVKPGSELLAKQQPFVDLSIIEAPLPAVQADARTEPVPVAVPLSRLASMDWSGFALQGSAPRKVAEPFQSAQSSVRVRAPVLDRLVNQAGEVSITRSRIESGVTQIKSALADLTENLERLRAQLRDIEFHGETQMSSRLEATKAASQSFDPLEFDRFTRFQELTRMMAESVNDVATVQRSVQRSLEATEDELVAQARLTRDLQNDLLRTRMVEFEGLSDRLYRVVRQAAKETGKSVRLDIVGGAIEVDRAVLDRMAGSFEHLLRNSVVHGIESPAVRRAAGKDSTGSIIVALSHEGNEVAVEFRDDGGGLNLERIRDKAVARGLLAQDAQPTVDELANLICMPGFSTAEGLTELAGRGVGMDVVRSDVIAMGGRMETATAAGRGTSFRMILPLTTAVTQVVMLRCGDMQVAVPSTLVEVVRRATPAEVDEAYATGTFTSVDKALQFFWLGALLQTSPRPTDSAGRTRMVVVIRSAQQRIALHVDEVMGNHEVVVKNLGPQLVRMPGLVGITLLASGAVTLIYNPVALATLYGKAARAATDAALHAATHAGVEPLLPGTPEVPVAPLVMVVDDSLTVRRVTQRLLLREGYRVVVAKDGLDALERFADEVPDIVLSDIEMPRMDGFDLVRNLRADARLRDLPVIMITSRIAPKHREYAAELGVDHYLGKPYAEDELLALIARYTAPRSNTDPLQS